MDVLIKKYDQRLGTEWPMPTYATNGSAGIDLRACIDTNYELQPDETQLVSTGIACEPTELNYAMLILPRSSLGHKHKVMISNSPGLVDNDYRGIIYVSLWNRGHEIYIIEPGERIAQAVFVQICQPRFLIQDELSLTTRYFGGFGSTGKH